MADPDPKPARSKAHAVATGVFALGGVLKRLVPAPVRQAIDDRFFYAVFNLTRVTNDDYVDPALRDRKRATRPRRS